MCVCAVFSSVAVIFSGEKERNEWWTLPCDDSLQLHRAISFLLRVLTTSHLSLNKHTYDLTTFSLKTSHLLTTFPLTSNIIFTLLLAWYNKRILIKGHRHSVVVGFRDREEGLLTTSEYPERCDNSRRWMRSMICSQMDISRPPEAEALRRHHLGMCSDAVNRRKGLLLMCVLDVLTLHRGTLHTQPRTCQQIRLINLHTRIRRQEVDHGYALPDHLHLPLSKMKWSLWRKSNMARYLLTTHLQRARWNSGL